MRKTILLILLFIITCFLYAQNMDGVWNGVLPVQGMKIRLVFNISSNGSVYTATVDSPDQGLKGMPVTKVDVIDRALKITIDNIGAVYEGQLEGDSIVGKFTQMGNSLPLNLNKNVIVLNRPQEPHKPYPYISEDVKFENKDAGIALGGTFTYPKEGKKVPAVVLITGSGAQNRDEELLGHKPFLVLSDYLTRQGIAVLRYDDRGVAESGGDFKTGTTKDFATDALAAFNYLKTRKEVDSKKIGLIGHSEGGIIAVMLAAENKDIAYIVSMAGSMLKGSDVLHLQRIALFKANGMSDQDIDKVESLNMRIQDIVEAYPIDSINNNIEAFAKKAFLSESVTKEEIAVLRAFAHPWMQYFIKYDPASNIAKVKCPVLALNGDKDLQVLATPNLEVLQRLLKADKLTVKRYPNLNHLFQHCQTGQPQEYSQIEETLSPEVLSDIAVWIHKTVK